MADPQKPPKTAAERTVTYRAILRSDLRRLEAKLDDLREQVAAMKSCAAERPERVLTK